jgi:hypothetical protein
VVRRSQSMASAAPDPDDSLANDKPDPEDSLANEPPDSRPTDGKA